MNGFWTFVFLVVVAGLVYDLIRKRHHFRHGHWEDSNGKVRPLNNPGDSAREAELQREVQELRERVKVLERIATDEHDPKRLAAEIERLRDE